MVYPLSNREIIKLIKNDFYGKKKFRGQIIARENPDIKKIVKKFKTGDIILLNTDRKDRIGMHWLVVQYRNDKTIFFDSLGKCPNQYAYPYTVSRRGLPVIRNTHKLQNLNSSYCGYFSVIYALLLARDYTLNEINKFFKQKKLYLNEDIAYEIIKWLQSKMRR